MDEELRKILKPATVGAAGPLGRTAGGSPAWPSLARATAEPRAGGGIAAKHGEARLLRRKRANIPEMLEIETFPFDRQPKLDRKRIMSLYDSFDYMTTSGTSSGWGPPAVASRAWRTGFLLHAIDRGYRGYFITFAELVAELFAVAGRSLGSEGAPPVLRRTTAW